MTGTETTGPTEQDAALLARVAADDMGALECLFARYEAPVRTFALGITRDAETAEEIVQDVFYRLYRNAGQLDRSLPLMPWLYRVTANLSYNRARRRRFWTEPFHALAERLLAPARREPERVAEQHELQAMVRATLDQLAPNHRAVLILYYLEEYTIAEIAGILDIPEGTIKSRLHHARRLLKDHLLRRYGAAATLLDQA
jgi:RNA polymerase sigma-70 factor (ECF subfamily)